MEQERLQLLQTYTDKLARSKEEPYILLQPKEYSELILRRPKLKDSEMKEQIMLKH